MRAEFTVQDNGKEIKLAVRPVNYEDNEEANRIYSSKVANLLRDRGPRKLLLRQQLDDYLRENGIWTDADQKKIDSLQLEIDNLLKQVKKGGQKLSKGRELCIEIMNRRQDMVKISSKRQMFDDVTIESAAENERLEYFVYTCTVHADSGENYWQSFEDMKNDKASNVYAKAYVNVMKNVYGIDPEFEKNLPENKWLKKYSFINDELEYTDRKTGEKVDKLGNPIKNLEEEVKQRIETLQGDIVEEEPFVDDETNEPIKV